MNSKSILPLLLFVVIALKLSAQFNPVRETERMMSFGSQPCFRMEFESTDASTVEDAWKKFAKDNFKAKLKKSKGEWTATKLHADFMGDDGFALYSTIENTNKVTALTVWVDAGAYFLNSRDNKVRTNEMLRTLRKCYYDVRRAAVGKEIKAQETALADMESKQKKMVKDNEDLRKSIESWESKIQKAKQDIQNNEKAQETNLVDQDNQRRMLEETRKRQENVENESGN